MESQAPLVTQALAALDTLRKAQRPGRGFGPGGGHGGPRHGHHHGHPHGAEGGADADDQFGPGFPGRRGRGAGALGGPVPMFARIRLLDALANGPQAVTALAELIGVDQPRASKLVAFGEANGHVTRRKDPNDARRTIVELTDSGRRLRERIHRHRAESVESGLAALGDRAEQFVADLAAFAGAFAASPGHGAAVADADPDRDPR